MTDECGDSDDDRREKIRAGKARKAATLTVVALLTFLGSGLTVYAQNMGQDMGAGARVWKNGEWMVTLIPETTMQPAKCLFTKSQKFPVWIIHTSSGIDFNIMSEDITQNSNSKILSVNIDRKQFGPYDIIVMGPHDPNIPLLVGAEIPLADQLPFFNALQHGRNLEMHSETQSWGFDLSSVSQTVTDLLTCANLITGGVIKSQQISLGSHRCRKSRASRRLAGRAERCVRGRFCSSGAPLSIC